MPKSPGAINGGLMQRVKSEGPIIVIKVANLDNRGL